MRNYLSPNKWASRDHRNYDKINGLMMISEWALLPTLIQNLLCSQAGPTAIRPISASDLSWVETENYFTAYPFYNSALALKNR